VSTQINTSVYAMAHLFRPGMQFHIFPHPPKKTNEINPTNAEVWPVSNCKYIVRSDMSIQSVEDPDLPIGWELIDENDRWYFRVGFTLEKCDVVLLGYEDVPQTKRVYSRADAMMIDFEDDGEPEVNSPLTCPGAPRKAPNPFFCVNE